MLIMLALFTEHVVRGSSIFHRSTDSRSQHTLSPYSAIHSADY